MTQVNLAERVGVDRTTIGKLEAGDPSTSLSTVLRVLSTLGLDQDIDRIAADDDVGLQLVTRSLRRPSTRQRKAVNAVHPPALDVPAVASLHQTHAVAEPEAERYALRASRRPSPINAPAMPVRGSKPRGGK